MATSQFKAGEEGRGFREALASNQNLFGQKLSSNQFNASERDSAFGRDFAGQQFRSGEQDRAFSRDLAGQQFLSGEDQRNFGNRFSSEGQFFNQQQAR